MTLNARIETLLRKNFGDSDGTEFYSELDSAVASGGGGANYSDDGNGRPVIKVFPGTESEADILGCDDFGNPYLSGPDADASTGFTFQGPRSLYTAIVNPNDADDCYFGVNQNDGTIEIQNAAVTVTAAGAVSADGGIGVFGTTAVAVQPETPAVVTALTDGTTGTPAGTLVDVTNTMVADPDLCNDNFASLNAKIDDLRTQVDALSAILEQYGFCATAP